MRLIFLFIIVAVSIFANAQTKTCWPNSRGNDQLQGYTTVKFPQTIKLKWTYDADGIFKSAPIICDNKIIVGSTNGDLLCLDLTGKLLWKFNTDNGIEAPALIKNNTVYFGNLSGTLFALDLQTGEKKWAYKTENQIMGTPAYFEKSGKKYLAVGSYDYYLHGVDAETGKGLWKYESDNFLNSAPAVVNGNAVFGGCDGFVHVVNMINGTLTKKVEVATYVASSPAIFEKVAYIGDYDGSVTAIDIITGTFKWQYINPDSNLPFIASPSIVDDKILLGCRDKFMYCFNRKNGELNWEKNTGSRIDASAIVNNKQVLLINMRGDLMVLNLKDGSIAWNYELGTSAINAPAVIENAIVIAGSDGNIYLLNSE